MKIRDYHKLAIIRREARGNTTFVPSKKRYIRKKVRSSDILKEY